MSSSVSVSGSGSAPAVRTARRSPLAPYLVFAAVAIAVLALAVMALLLSNGSLRSQVAALRATIDAAAPGASAKAIADADRISALEAEVARLKAAAAASAQPAAVTEIARAVTLDDFEILVPGMTYAGVCAIIGFEGELVQDGGNRKTYRWRGNGTGRSSVECSFEGGNLQSKNQSGLQRSSGAVYRDVVASPLNRVGVRPVTIRDYEVLVEEANLGVNHVRMTYTAACELLGSAGQEVTKIPNSSSHSEIRIYRWPGNGGDSSFIELAFRRPSNLPELTLQWKRQVGLN